MCRRWQAGYVFRAPAQVFASYAKIWAGDDFLKLEDIAKKIYHCAPAML